MASSDHSKTIQKTEWTGSLLEDLCNSLKGGREDDTVRGFARELMDDKNLPLEYLVRKVQESVGQGEAERLEVLIRGRHAVEKSRAQQARGKPGMLGFVRKLLK